MLGIAAANRRRSAAAPAYPLTLAPRWWFDPSDMATLFQDSAGTIPVTADGDPVGRVLDKSGNNRHVSQATAANRPIFRDAGGLRWLEYDGSNDAMVSAAFNITQPFTAGLAVLFDAGAGVGNAFADGANSNIMGSTVGNAYRMYAGVTLSGGARDGNPHTMIGKFNGAASELLVDTAVLASGNAGTFNGSLGVSLGVAGMDGRIYQSIGIPGTFADADRDTLQAWLAGKAGL